MKMSGESPYHTMSEGDIAMEMDNDLSMYQSDVVGLGGGKPGVEVPHLAGEEVVISNNGGAPSPAPGSQTSNSSNSTAQVLEDQRVEEFMVEIPLDQEEDDEYSRDSLQSVVEEGQQPVYTMLEPAMEWSTQLLTSTTNSCDSDSADSGLGGSEKSSIVSKKNSFERLPSQDGESSDLCSWTQLHPDNWTSREVLDWVYHLAEQENNNIDLSQLRGEAFDVNGPTLCSWTKADFIKADPQHGVAIYDNFKILCGIAGDFVPPEEVTDSTGYDHQPFINPLVQDIEDGSSPIRSAIDPYLPQSDVEKVIQISGQPYTIDAKDMFEDIEPVNPFGLPTTSGVHTSIKHGNGGLVRHMAMTSSRTSFSVTSVPQYHPTVTPALTTEADSTTTTTTTMATPHTRPLTTNPGKRGRGRPRKQPSADEGSDGEYVPYKSSRSSGGPRGGPRGKRPHSNRMLHLWEFIRDLLLDPKYNPTLIRWENRREGVFRVIRSKEVARMWGVRKQNPEMTYEKFSRSMRFCRTAEYFGEVPKDGKYPKKLCFAFGPRAHGWQPNSVISHCYYNKM